MVLALCIQGTSLGNSSPFAQGLLRRPLICPLIASLVKAQPKQATSFCCVRELGRPHELVHIEVWAKAVAGKSVRVHSHDVLITHCRGVVGAKLERFSDLTLVHTVEQMAIMNEEARP